MEQTMIRGKVYDFDAYYTMTQQLVAEKKTSGHNQTEALIQFTALNLKRMERILKTFSPDENFSAVAKHTTPQTWILITEAWCGDSAQNLPILAKLAKASEGKIKLDIILRDENPEWMDAHLTNGTRSVPKMISADENGNELFSWGPRPAPAMEILRHWKANQETMSHDDFEKELHTWYAKDKGQTLMHEIEALLK